jgi:hypothetical protein
VDLQITRWIREQDENGAVSLARTLCMAEAGRYGLRLDSVSFSGRVKAADQGIDGRTDFPSDLDSYFPRGLNVWQIKSGSSTPSATAELREETHAGLIEAIRQGADYVLLWTNDPTDVVRTNVRTNFSQAVQKVRADANVLVLFADEIERLCYQHLAVLAQSGPVPIRGLVGLETWAPREFELVEYQPDEARLATIELLREHVARASEPDEIHVFGDTGVGKSRLVYESLAQDGIRERVLVAPDPSGWDHGLLTTVASTPGSSLVLVVDDCEADDRRALTKLVGMSRGRIRLITIGSRANRERHAEDRRRRELLPLGIEASQRIALSMGLDEQQASVVAGLTEGYPGLAATLAKAIAYGGPDTTLLDRIRGDENIGPVLATLVDVSEVPLLGLIALFERIGFEGDLALELTLACEVFGVDEAAARAVADRELQRFVSTAGRFRRVTPRLFAVWLASRFLEMRAATIVGELEQLPESLRERIVDQMREFAGDAVVSHTLGALMEQTPFLSGAIAGVDDGAARLLHVASIVNPQAAMNTIERIMEGVSPEVLRQARAGRHDLVRALEVLLWFDELFERAATASLRLAMAENEDWSNNATGLIRGIFRVFLGGTSADYDRRVAWSRAAINEYGDSAAEVLVPGMALAFDAHESRFSTDFGGRVAPPEWRPPTVADEIAARRSAWGLLVELASREPEARELAASSLAQGVRIAMRRGLSMDVLTTIGTIDWSARARTELVEALNHARAYDNLDDALDREVRELVAALIGAEVNARAEYVLAGSLWELTDDRDELVAGQPKVLLDLAEDLVGQDSSTWHRLAEMSRTGNPDTTSRLFEELAKKAPSIEFERELENLDSPPVPALTGYLRGLVVVGAADPVSILDRWSEAQHLRGEVIQAAHLMPPSDELARLAMDAVEHGASEARELGRLLYGAWARNLHPDVVADLLKLLVDDIGRQLDADDPGTALHTLDQALGIADQWTEENTAPATGSPLRSVISNLLALTETAEGRARRSSSMLDLHVSRIVPRLGLDLNDRLAMLIGRFKSLQSFPSEYDLAELDRLATMDPATVATAVLELLGSSEGGQFRPWSMWLGDANVLTRLRPYVNSDELTELVLRKCAPGAWPDLVAHINFDTDEPDPLLVALLGKSDDSDLRGRAGFRFMHPQSVSMGTESENLRRRMASALRWRQAPEHPPLFVEWLEQVIDALEANISRAEQREAEGRW